MKNFFQKVKLFWKNHPQWSSILLAVFSFVLLQIVSGVISSSAYNWFQSIFIPWSTKQILINNFILLAIIFVLLVMGIAGWLIGKSSNTQIPQATLLEYNNQLRLLGNVHATSYLNLIIEINKQIQLGFETRSDSDTLEKLIDKFFLAVFDCLGNEAVLGGAIILPDIKSSDWLSFWRMSPDQPLSPKRFFIGKAKENSKDFQLRGAAGTVYLNNHHRIVKITDPKSGTSDDLSFHKFVLERPETPYLSFILLPIHWKKKVIGVLTIEGKERDTFDFENITWLQGLADILGTILWIFGKVS
jgi:hypothetical protein